jgi:hypothetical protein
MTNKRTRHEPFVALGPENARKGREAGGLREPPVVSDAPQDAGLIRRLWAYLSSGSGDLRKLWGSSRTP